MKTMRDNIAQNANLSGIIYMLVAMFSLATMDALAKYLVKDSYDPIQILAMRSWIILAAMLVYYITRRKLHKLYPTKPLAQLARGLFGFLAPYCFFKSLQTLPLADATVIFFSSTFMITALSGPLLKEKVGLYRWSAVVLGFVGVLIAMDAQGDGALTSYAYCLAGSFSYSILFISGRWLARTESVDSLVFFFNFCMVIIATSLTPMVWNTVAVADYGTILLFSAFALVGHFCVTNAFSRANVAVIAPLEYTALIWAALWGYLIWAEIPGTRVMIGGAVIISCALFVVYRETHNARKARRAKKNIAQTPLQ
ncbi:MAG: drug/metabolite transporter (DMT)-like permease [Oceanospirillaceae bacterium]|jgi:drug/metabolite transporter (DMT)-like permease